MLGRALNTNSECSVSREEDCLTAELSKCERGATSLQYCLGHTVWKGKVSIPDAKIEGLKNFKRHKTKTDLTFLGTIGYFRRFVTNFLQKPHPLTDPNHRHL